MYIVETMMFRTYVTTGCADNWVEAYEEAKAWLALGWLHVRIRDTNNNSITDIEF